MTNGPVQGHDVGPRRAGDPCGTARHSLTEDFLKHCRLGASAIHLNTGERWWVTMRKADGRLVIQAQSDGHERVVTRDYWLGDSWAER